MSTRCSLKLETSFKNKCEKAKSAKRQEMLKRRRKLMITAGIQEWCYKYLKLVWRLKEQFEN